MYKLLLCWRYLRTRYIALASIVSVMLGVATMIVVNAVMSGFTTEMQGRIHAILSDVVFESRSINGFADVESRMEQIRRVAGDSIEGMTPVVAVPAMLNFRVGEEWITRQIQLIGIDQKTQNQVNGFSEYLQHPSNRQAMSFDLRKNGYDTQDHQADADTDAPERWQMADAGWNYRRQMAELRKFRQKFFDEKTDEKKPAETPSPVHLDFEALANDSFTFDDFQNLCQMPFFEKPDQALLAEKQDASEPALDLSNPFNAGNSTPINTFDPAREQHEGIVLGIALASYRLEIAKGEYEDRFLVLPGDDVKVTLPTAGTPPKGVTDSFTVVDFYESKMSEYDSSFVFVPIEHLQKLRGMYDPSTGVTMVNSIQIKLKPDANLEEVRDKLRAAFPPELFVVSTWRDKQGPLLAAVEMETNLLNVLLFLIIAVAGFGILAIFMMIVVEKTRDIGVLKSLGASGSGIMGIFLSYGLTLGMVGSGVGLGLGLIFVHYINEIADILAWLTGRPVFDPAVYYFYKIPTIIEAGTVGWIVLGALAIAVLASVLPAFRAARLHPVEALRYE